MEPRKLVAWGLMTALLAFGAKAQEISKNMPGVFAELKCYQECDMSKYERNYLGSLNYPDCGEIIECGLAQVAMIKLAQPRTELRTLKKKVDELISSGETPNVRFKAYLTSVVFEHPEWFIYEKYGSYPDGDAFFNALAERLQKKLLALK